MESTPRVSSHLNQPTYMTVRKVVEIDCCPGECLPSLTSVLWGALETSLLGKYNFWTPEL